MPATKPAGKPFARFRTAGRAFVGMWRRTSCGEDVFDWWCDGCQTSDTTGFRDLARKHADQHAADCRAVPPEEN